MPNNGYGRDSLINGNDIALNFCYIDLIGEHIKNSSSVPRAWHMIIITDAHISKAAGNHATFFRMLGSLENHRQDLIFLGDIFDLWVALPRYEDEAHRRFRAWCREQKKQRTIGFMEGNHEYYLARCGAMDFSWCSDAAWWREDDGILFVHGDQVNRRDRIYLTYRKIAKSPIARFIMHILPFGPRMADWLKHGLKHTNMDFRKHLPREEIESFADAQFAEGVDTIFVGHFHQEYTYRNSDSQSLYVLPDWFSTEKVTVYDPKLQTATSLNWKQITGTR
jgi:UDP-2,3-diacylglucosamine pyrophosphatase LpxH